MLDYNKYFQKNRLDKFSLKKDHDGNHLFRVLFLSLSLCDKLDVKGADREIVAFASMYHDVGRNNDDFDIMHGIRGWKKVKHIFTNDFDEKNKQIVKYIIENHCIPDQVAYKNVSYYTITNERKMTYLLNIEKDADSLDITRFGFFEEKYLRFAQSKELIPLANILNELGDVIKDPSKLQKKLIENGLVNYYM